MGIPHVLVIPYPAQGHVIPMMELSQSFINYGFKVTFVNSEFNHKRVVNSFSFPAPAIGDHHIRLVSIPDGMELHEDRNQLDKLTEALLQIMPVKLEELIQDINKSDCDEITCVVADMNVGWALQVAAKMGIKRAAFCPASASFLALSFSIQSLIDDGIIDHEGTPLKHEMVQLSPNMPVMKPAKFVWANMGDLEMQKIILETMKSNAEDVQVAEWFVCNTNYNLERAAFTLAPQFLPIGPLYASEQQGGFWAEDSTCLTWLDQQPPLSVIYVAFGSFTVFDKTQFQELALGLELSNRPFLWVVRPDITDGIDDAFPEGFVDRVGDRGRMVGWAPQVRVLRHPSVACFVTHCGWNSTMEGVSNGVPFLCWPYFADQFINETYICDIWKVGLNFKKDESGIIPREEIKGKVEQLLDNDNDNDNFKGRASHMKEMVRSDIKENGCSYKNMKNFMEWIKAE